MRITEYLKMKLFDGTDKLDYKVINENIEKIDGSLDELNSNLVKCSDTSKIKLNTLSWIKSASGMYYYELNIDNVNNLLSVSIFDWGSLRTTDNVSVAINGTKLQVLSNVTSFASNESYVIMRYLYN